jgi:hypothetical protein
MTKAMPIFTILVVLGIVTPAWAQGSGRAGGAFDVLNDALRVNRTVRGHVVQHREGTLVLLGDDDRTHTINTVDLDLDTLRGVRDGRPVVVALKSPVPGTMPIAVSLQPADGPTKVFRRVEGTVDAVSDDQIRFTTRDGMTLTLDRGRIVGEAPYVVPNETATLVYEQEPRIAGVWIEMREVQPAATPRGEP